MSESNISCKEKTCNIHKGSSLSSQEGFAKLEDYKSWVTLLEAAKVRNHATFLNISQGSKKVKFLIFIIIGHAEVC